MTVENLQRHHARLKWLASGEFTERDFDFKIKANENPNGKEKGEGGWSTMGSFENKAGNARKELIIHKAKKALARFEKNYLKFKDSVPEKVVQKAPEEKPTKSVEKK